MDATDVVLGTVAYMSLAVVLGGLAIRVLRSELEADYIAPTGRPGNWWKWLVIVGSGFGCLASVLMAISIVVGWLCG